MKVTITAFGLVEGIMWYMSELVGLKLEKENMPGCAAFRCSNSAKKGFLMKKFPKDPQRRKIWLIQTRRADWTPTDFSVLCEMHFESEMWEKTRQDGSRKLKCNAVPTIFCFNRKKQARKPLKTPKVLKSTDNTHNDDSTSVTATEDFTIVKEEPQTSSSEEFENYCKENFLIVKEEPQLSSSEQFESYCKENFIIVKEEPQLSSSEVFENYCKENFIIVKEEPQLSSLEELENCCWTA